jgi:hypothetical protein
MEQMSWDGYFADTTVEKFNNVRHTYPDGTTYRNELDTFNKDFVNAVLFTPQDHALFYALLINYGLHIEAKCGEDGADFRFNVKTCRDIALSLLNLTDKDNAEERVSVLVKKIQVRTGGTSPFVVIGDELKQICQEIAKLSSSDHGASMVEYRIMELPQNGPVANMIFFNVFSAYIHETKGDWFRIPQRWSGDYPEKFKNHPLMSFVTNPLGIQVSLEETTPKRRHYKLPLPTDFPACRPDITWPGGEFPEVYEWRQHIYNTLWANDCFIGFRSGGLDLSKLRNSKGPLLGPIPTIGSAAFWNVEACDFNSKIGKRERPRGVWLPIDVANELHATDQMLLGQGRGVGVRLGEQGVRVLVNKDKQVRFASKDKVHLHTTTTVNKTPVESKPLKGEEDEQTKTDNKNLALLGAGTLGFLGLFYYLD